MMKIIIAGLMASSLLAQGNATSVIEISKDDKVIPTITGSDKIAREQRQLADFTAIHASNSANIIVTVGKAYSVEVAADDNIIGNITTTSKNGVLSIGSTGSYSTKSSPVVTITMPQLTAVKLKGSGSARIDGMRGGALELDGTGSGGFKVSGRADLVKLNISGSGSANLSGLDVRDADVSIYGSGSANIRATGRLRADVFGSGNIRYSGTDDVQERVHGSGKITRLTR